MVRMLLVEPEIPGNTGNVIRLSAVTGAELHLVEPLGFDFDDAKLRRAGLDYHDLAGMHVHTDLEAAWEALRPQRVFAFTTDATPAPVEDARIRQGFLEESNVDSVFEITRMIEVQRAYELGQSFLDREDQRIRSAIAGMTR